MADLIFIGLDRAGLEEAQRDRDNYAAKLAEKLYPFDVSTMTEMVSDAIQCDREWPTCEKSAITKP